MQLRREEMGHRLTVLDHIGNDVPAEITLAVRIVGIAPELIEQEIGA